MRTLYAITVLCIFYTGAMQSAQAQALIAHRGASHDAPENTLAAFRLAWKMGADGIEGDFQLTKDGRIVCLHDADTGRVGDKKLQVADSTLEELRSVDVGLWRGAAFVGERIPTLAETLAIVPDGKRIFVEIKCGPEIVPALVKELESSSLKREQIAVICFNAQTIDEVRKRIPNVNTYWLKGLPAKDAPPPNGDEILATLKQIRATGLDADSNLKCLTADFVKRLAAEGFELHCWTVNDETIAKRVRALGARSITTDRPDHLRAIFSSQASETDREKSPPGR